MKRNVKRFIALGLSLGMFLSTQALSVSADEWADTVEVSSADAVVLYADYDSTGTSQAFYPGDYDLADLEGGVGNDNVSSIAVPQGYKVTIFNDQHFSGTSAVLTCDFDRLYDINFDDKISSLRVEAITPVVTVYSDADYSGNEQVFDLGDYDWGSLMLVGSDKISSVRIEPGYEVILYDNANFGGSSKTVKADLSNLNEIGFNDKVSSLKVVGGSAEPEKPIEPTPTDAVVLYADYDSTGIWQSFSPGDYDLADLEGGVGSDNASSITVPQGYKVTIFEHGGFSGASAVLTCDFGRLYDINFDDKISSLRVEAIRPVVTVYSDADYSGNAQVFDLGDYDWGSLMLVGNDKISSVRVQPGYEVVLYQDANFGGSWKTVNVDCSNLKGLGFNDNVSSLKVVEDLSDPVVTVYRDAEYSSGAQEFGVGDFDWDTINAGVGNDQISSVRVRQGYKVTLYDNVNFGGGTLELTADCIDLSKVKLNDKTSSLRIEPFNPLDDTCIDITNLDDAQMEDIMMDLAPIIYMAKGEEYMPSSVGFAMEHTSRKWMDSEQAYWYVTNEAVRGTDTKLDYFKGDLANVESYAFWVEKNYNNVDISYFQFCPYNLGKTVLGMEFGNHVGDWEHVTVRLARFHYEGREYLKPIQAAVPSHSFVNFYTWDQMEKYGTNMIVYSAKASHGMWKDAGNHVYNSIPELTDECSRGASYNTWENLRMYQYDAQSHEGRGVNGRQSWPSYFDTDYSNPDSMSAARWGNPKDGTFAGMARLDNGPTGPENKWALSDYTVLN